MGNNVNPAPNKSVKCAHPTSNQFSAFMSLTVRHLKVFFKNIPTVIFTMMVPLTIFIVYLLFLRNIQIQEIRGYFENFDSLQRVTQQRIFALADSWMISGVLGVSCITVSMNCQYIMVKDKENQLNRDMISSPINPNVIMMSYFFFNIIVTFLINLIVFFVSMVVLAVNNAYLISFLDFCALVGIILYSTVVASLFSFLVASFVNTEAVMSPLIATCCAGVGFLIGAYLPYNMMPEYINNLTAFFPGTYSVGLFRHFLMGPQVTQLMQDPALTESQRQILMSGLTEQFNIFGGQGSPIYVAVHFFGMNINPGYMNFVLFLFVVILLIADLITLHFKKFMSMNNDVIQRAKARRKRKEAVSDSEK